MKRMTLAVKILTPAVVVFLLIYLLPSDTLGWCPTMKPAPKPDKPVEQPKPATPAERPQDKPPAAQSPSDQTPAAQPATPAPAPEPPPPPPEKPSDTAAPSDQPQKPTDQNAAQPNQGGDSSSGGNSNPNAPKQGGISKGTVLGGAKGSTAQIIPRPPLSFGFQPRLNDMTLGRTTNLLGAVEPWEVWWSRNRLNYLKFRQPIEFIKRTADGYVKVIKQYDDIGTIFIKALADQNQYVAVSAAMGLSKLTDVRAIDALKKSFNDENRIYVENNDILALGLCNSSESIFLLRETLKNKKDTELNRSFAAVGLGYITNNEEVLKVLRNACIQPDKPEVVASCALSLGNLKDHESTGLLGKLLNSGVAFQGDKYAPQVRSYAALALGRLGTKEALIELKKAVEDKDKDVRACVAIALGDTKQPTSFVPLNQMLRDHDLATRGFAAVSLAQIPDKNVYPALLLAYQSNNDMQVDGMIVLAMGLCGDPKAVPELQRLITAKNKRPLLKGAAVIALGLLKDKSSVPLIADLLEDKKTDPILAPYAITSLGMLGDAKSVEILAKIWDKISARYITDIAYTNLAVALTMLGKRDELVIPQLKKNFDKKEIAVIREHAFHSAGLIGTKDVIPNFLNVYDGETDPQIREYLINGLGFLVDTNETPLITKVTSDNDYNVFMMIMEHLLYLPVW